ncbi:MAG: FecR family protein [Armatimonadetes bacterium]|nr:FecR family protein [Armatimonadota bacterium]
MRLIVALAFFVLLLLAAVAVMSTKTIQIAQRVSVVKFVSGEAYVERFGLESKRKPLKKGMLVKTFDVVRTGENGRVILRWVDDFQIELKPKTVLRVLRSSFDKGKGTTTSLFFLRSGEAVAKFERKLSPGSTFELRTPVVMAAVRGTEFSTRIERDGSVTVKVYSGVVTLKVSSTGKEFALKVGEVAHFRPDGSYKISGVSEAL